MDKRTYRVIAASLLMSFFLTNVSPAWALVATTQEQKEVLPVTSDEQYAAAQKAVDDPTLIDATMAQVNVATIQAAPAAPVTTPAVAQETGSETGFSGETDTTIDTGSSADANPAETFSDNPADALPVNTTSFVSATDAPTSGPSDGVDV